jgi:hypothetical protein
MCGLNSDRAVVGGLRISLFAHLIEIVCSAEFFAREISETLRPEETGAAGYIHGLDSTLGPDGLKTSFFRAKIAPAPTIFNKARNLSGRLTGRF